MGLAYSIVLTDAVIAPAFPSNTARGGVLFPVVLSVAEGAGSRPQDPEGRRLGGYLMFCAMASLAVSSALWMTATSANPIGIQVVRDFGIEIGFGKWLVVACVPSLTAILARISHEDSCNRLSRGLDGALLAIRAAIWARRQVGRAER